MRSSESEFVVSKIGQGRLAIAGASRPPQQPLAAVEAGNKVSGMVAVDPGGLQVRPRRADFEAAVEGGVAIAEPDQPEQRLHDRPAQLVVYGGHGVVVAVDVAAHTGATEQ